MRINTNVSSLIARNAMRENNADYAKAMERLSSGLRINGASDDAAGLAISERLQTQIRGMEQAYANTQDGISLIQTAEGSLGVIADILQRMRELAIQADNGTYSDADRASLQHEVALLLEEVNHIANTSSFNSINLLNNDIDVTLHVSDQATDTITFQLLDVRTDALGISGIDIAADAQGAIELIDASLDLVSETRATLGSTQNRLEFIGDNLTTTTANTESSNSVIQDADMAAETSNLSRAELLTNTAMAMLSKANQQPQQIQQLLQQG